MNERARKAAISAINKALSFLEDNVYRYRMDDGGTGRHAETIADHDSEIAALKEAKLFLERAEL